MKFTSAHINATNYKTQIHLAVRISAGASLYGAD